MKKNIITTLIVIGAALAVFGGLNHTFGFIEFGYLSSTNHGDRETWIKNHQYTYERLVKSDLQNKNCLGCHEQKFHQTKANFCNKCHEKSGVPLVK